MTSKNGELSYIDKAAVLIMNLESHSPGMASRIFSQIGEKRSKVLIKAITNMGKVDYPVVNSIMEEFYALAIEQKGVFGGKNVSKKILEDSFGIHEQDDYFQDKKGMFDFLSLVPQRDLLSYLSSEGDQLVALLLSFMGDEQMARLMSTMSVDRSSSLSKAILHLEIPNYKLIWRFHHILQEKLLGKSVDDGIKNEHQIFKLSRALEMMSSDSRDNVMDILRRTDAYAVTRLEKLIFSFEDLDKLEDRHIQNILYEIDPLKLLAVALRGLSDSFVNTIESNISDRVSLMLDEEISILGAIVLELDVMTAQNEIVQISRRLEREGVDMDIFIEKESLNEVLSVSYSDEELEINMGNVLLFELGSTELRQGAQKVLTKVSEVFNTSEGKIVVEGHTDDIPIATQQYPSNWELSSARASSVIRFLFENKVKQGQFMVVGYNQYDPLVPNTSDVNLSKNRRVKITVRADRNTIINSKKHEDNYD